MTTQTNAEAPSPLAQVLLVFAKRGRELRLARERQAAQQAAGPAPYPEGSSDAKTH